MKKALLFVTGAGIGAVTGFVGAVVCLLIGVAGEDKVLYEDDKMRIRAATDSTEAETGFAVVTYKKQTTETNE